MSLSHNHEESITTHSTTSQHHALSLFDLPPEIRNRIYDDVFSDTVFRIVRGDWHIKPPADTSHQQHHDQRYRHCYPSELNLFLTNRQVRRESQRSLYAATFWFQRDPKYRLVGLDLPPARRLLLRSIVVGRAAAEDLFNLARFDRDLVDTLPCLEHVRMIGFDFQRDINIQAMCQFTVEPRRYHFQIFLEKPFKGWQTTVHRFVGNLAQSPYTSIRVTERRESSYSSPYFDPLTLLVDNRPSLGSGPGGHHHQCPTPWRFTFDSSPPEQTLEVT